MLIARLLCERWPLLIRTRPERERETRAGTILSMDEVCTSELEYLCTAFLVQVSEDWDRRVETLIPKDFERIRNLKFGIDNAGSSSFVS